METGAYLARIGYDGPPQPGHETLARLQRAHLLTVPFDALDCHLGRPVTVWPVDAYRKVAGGRRGGFCFELNGLFAWLLEELGFAVTLAAARPFVAGGLAASPRAHLALIVEADGPWLVDVGFGFPFALTPLRLDAPGEQVTGAAPSAPSRMRPAGGRRSAAPASTCRRVSRAGAGRAGSGGTPRRPGPERAGSRRPRIRPRVPR